MVWADEGWGGGGSYVMYKLRNTEETKIFRLYIAKEDPQGSHPSLLNKSYHIGSRPGAVLQKIVTKSLNTTHRS